MMTMEHLRKGEVVNEELPTITHGKNASEVFPLLVDYLQDTLLTVRRQAYRYLGRMGMHPANDTLQQQVVVLLVSGCGKEPAVIVKQIVDYLSRYPASAFTAEAIKQVTALITDTICCKGDICRLAAKVPDSTTQTRLKQQLQVTTTPSVKWDIYLALARLGDEAAIGTLLNELQRLPLNNGFVETLVPGLLYTQRKAVYDYLLGQVLKSEGDCYTQHPDKEQRVDCAYFLMEQLAGNIVGYPVKANAYGETTEPMTRATLEETRAWIKENINSYTIAHHE